jgi:putative membrane protein
MTGRQLRLLGRVAAAALGLGCLLATLTPPLADAMTFDRHAVRHLLLAMLAPLAFALSAPVTLALRTFPRRPRRALLALLHSQPARALTTAPVVLALDVGGMYAFYLTPLYSASHHRPWLSALVDLHMLLAGCLLSWYLVGRDPMPSPPSTRTRLVVLLLAAGSHDLLAKLMYAHQLPAHGGSTEQLQLGAQIMFYGGDVVEVALAVLVLANWYARTGRQLRRAEQAERAAAKANPRRLGSPLPRPGDPG